MATLVDTVEACRIAVEELLLEQEIGVDIEGESLSRDGSIALIQITNGGMALDRDGGTTDVVDVDADANVGGDSGATNNAGAGVSGATNKPATVYLFDIHLLQSRAFEEGGLRRLFESPEVLKIFFDVRADVDALYHIYGVNVTAVYDLQVLYHIKFIHSSNKFLKGLHNALTEFAEASGMISLEKRAALALVKDEGKKLFAPEHGGSYAAWTIRPLNPVLIEYAASDATYLLHMRKFWGGKDAVSPLATATDTNGSHNTSDNTSSTLIPPLPCTNPLTLDEHVKTISTDRAAAFVGLPQTMGQDVKKRRDFPIPLGFNKTGHITKEMDVPQHRLGLVIGKKGATIKSIQASTGASSIHLDGRKVYVTGKPEQVDVAMAKIQEKINGPSNY